MKKQMLEVTEIDLSGEGLHNNKLKVRVPLSLVSEFAVTLYGIYGEEKNLESPYINMDGDLRYWREGNDLFISCISDKSIVFEIRGKETIGALLAAFQKQNLLVFSIS